MRKFYKDIKSRDVEIKRLSEYITNQNGTIADLRMENKNYEYANYSAEIIRIEWDCGDGCCSDSWSVYRVEDGNGKIVKEGGNKYWDRSACKQAIFEEYGDKILISYFRRDSDKDEEFQDYQ
jgi:hypothetical protein